MKIENMNIVPPLSFDHALFKENKREGKDKIKGNDFTTFGVACT